MKEPIHPSQPLIVDGDGVVRFKKNEIVDFLLRCGGFDMNQLAAMRFSNEDRAQFAQLTGYSVCGWSDLSYVLPAAARKAEEQVIAVLARHRIKPARKLVRAHKIEGGRS